ncbi:hypothetical protein [Flavivirga aquatica]|uniref:hypothetical protein n=1 Tax=Flavivirga aquatica TaxID=1849968 RepID=UPI0013F4E04F|nr:hypothetical protein [Flavivirga aquatica]
MRDLKVLLVLTVLCTGLLTSCTKQELNEEDQFKENFQGVDRGVQRPGTQGQ